VKAVSFFRHEDPTVDYKAGDVIFREGDAGKEMYCVVEGAVELRTGDRVLELVDEEGVFGELALADHTPRNLTAIATQDTRLAVIDERRFLVLVHETPTFALTVISTVAARLRALTRATEGT